MKRLRWEESAKLTSSCHNGYLSVKSTHIDFVAADDIAVCCFDDCNSVGRLEMPQLGVGGGICVSCCQPRINSNFERRKLSSLRGFDSHIRRPVPRERAYDAIAVSELSVHGSSGLQPVNRIAPSPGVCLSGIQRSTANFDRSLAP
jgi:hypothetical protein